MYFLTAYTLFSLYIHVYSFVRNLTLDEMSKCSPHCECDLNTINCSLNIPKYIPSNVTMVTVSDVSQFSYVEDNSLFRDLSWTKVIFLSITCNDKANIVQINANVFKALSNLTHLTFAAKHLQIISIHAFIGLDKLETLELKDCVLLSVYTLTTVLRQANSLLQLNNLYLPNLAILSREFPNFNSIFFIALTNKTIKRLDLSGIPLGTMDPFAFSVCLPHLQSVNFDSSGRLSIGLLFAYDLNSEGDSFKNLKDINLSNMRIPKLNFEMAKSYQALFGIVPLIKKSFTILNITSFELRGMVLPGERMKVETLEDSIRICIILVIIDIPLKIPTICLTNLNKHNSLPTLRLVDVSDTGIENIDVRLYACLQQVRFINCSFNRLTSIHFITGPNDNTSKPAMLEELHCSNNLIESIPTTIGQLWSSITIIDMSHNMLQTIPSDMAKLALLRILDFSYNKITFLDAHITHTFDQFHTDVIKERVYGLKLNIDGNLFECKCTDESLHFISWLQNSEVISNPKRNIRRCSFQDTIFEIDEFVIDKISYSCNLPILIALLICSNILFIALVLVVCWRVRRYRKQIQLRKIIKKYKREDNFAVFLSYAGMDAEFVMDNILNTMDMHLRNILGTDKQCVATGDFNFWPGFSVPEEIIRCINKSAVVVFCISKEFCKSRWCENEVFIACYDKKPIVLMYLEPVDKHELPKLLTKPFQKTKTSKWILNKKGEHEIIPKWDKVCHSIVGLIPSTKIILDLKEN